VKLLGFFYFVLIIVLILSDLLCHSNSIVRRVMEENIVQKLRDIAWKFIKLGLTGDHFKGLQYGTEAVIVNNHPTSQ